MTAERLHRTVSTYGVCLSLTAPDTRLLDLMTTRLPPRWEGDALPPADRTYDLASRAEGIQGGGFALSADGCGLVQGTLDAALDMLDADVQTYVAEMAPDHVFLHAGALGWKGRAIVVPGRSRSGKTTLVAELLRAGATYYSDEFAVLDAGGRVHPYPGPLSMRREGGASLRVKPRDLGSVAGSEPLPIGLIVLSEYRAGGVWRPDTLSAGRAVLEMIAHTVSIRRQPAAAMLSLQLAAAGARVLQGERGEAAPLALKLLEEVYAVA
jgi:hypothetical protein